MTGRKSTLLILVLISLCLAAPAPGDIVPVPDLALSNATMENYPQGHPLVLRHRPDGSGSPFTEAVSAADNSVQDATITLTLLDNYGFPIVNFPYVDMWLETSGGGLVPCSLYFFADHHTDMNGETTWSDPLHAGGYAGGDIADRTRVMINGESLLQSGFSLWHNSPDINGDGWVNVTDVQIFSVDYFAYAADPSDYEFRSDLEYDGVVNVTDIVPLAQGQGHNCP